MNKFWNNIQRTEGCWEWLRGKNSKGYGQLVVNGKVLKAHRVSYELHFGEIQKGLCVLHKCDNPSCVKPEHLFLGTKADNNRDMTKKGRGVYPVGEAHGMSKVSDEEVEEIKELRSRGYRLKKIATMFGMGVATVSDICLGKTRQTAIRKLTEGEK